ncbi:glycoside hydrolase family 3 protein [Blastococcus brunescens]|uniref:Glycoside hydrolase family 3 N-terminal domain-containing protein n=1 Tax=Blastococcus brunescens TaxID=1564165 RepID=A0ABZ1B0I6_9ACTN|nr:glycoside hydrolase family 3 N-terminal domain-containing protein [Blastococcus sp. BMG 8361]WRL64244.1 glycoside hydrolase family 3 N-terminal domain-containing protein [Blastococcus sp. BMG 8361]
MALDEEGGDVTRLEYLTGSSYPGNLALGVVDDPAVTEAVAAAIGADLRRAGVTVDFAPSVDVNSDSRNPVIGVRSFGPDPDAVARHGVAYVRGLQSAGVAATAKHFPGHGATTVDSHLGLPTIDADAATFRRRELPPFAAAVRAGVDLVMTSHVVFSALDARPATLSRRLLVDLLRTELGFAGVVVTDALDMAGVRAAHGVAGAGCARWRPGPTCCCWARRTARSTAPPCARASGTPSVTERSPRPACRRRPGGSPRCASGWPPPTAHRRRRAGTPGSRRRAGPSGTAARSPCPAPRWWRSSARARTWRWATPGGAWPSPWNAGGCSARWSRCGRARARSRSRWTSCSPRRPACRSSSPSGTPTAASGSGPGCAA